MWLRRRGLQRSCQRSFIQCTIVVLILTSSCPRATRLNTHNGTFIHIHIHYHNCVCILSMSINFWHSLRFEIVLRHTKILQNTTKILQHKSSTFTQMSLLFHQMSTQQPKQSHKERRSLAHTHTARRTHKERMKLQ